MKILCEENKFGFDSMATLWFNVNGNGIVSNASFQESNWYWMWFKVDVFNTKDWETLFGWILHRNNKKKIVRNGEIMRICPFWNGIFFYRLNFKRKTYLWECECVCMNFTIEPARFNFNFPISQKVLCFSTPNGLVQCTNWANAEAGKSQEHGEFHDDFYCTLITTKQTTAKSNLDFHC